MFLLIIKDLCVFELGIICLSWLFFFLLKRKHCRCIVFICWDVCFTPKRQATSSFTCIDHNQGLSSDLNWHPLISFLIKCTTLYKIGFPWLMFSTKVTFDSSKTYTRYWYGGPDIKEVITKVYIMRSLILIMWVKTGKSSLCHKWWNQVPDWAWKAVSWWWAIPLTNWIIPWYIGLSHALPENIIYSMTNCETIPHGYMYMWNIMTAWVMTDMRNLGLGW